MARIEVDKLANQVLSMKHLGINEAMQIVLGEYSDKNANTYQAVFDAVQDIQYPHGTANDAVYCEY